MEKQILLIFCSHSDRKHRQRSHVLRFLYFSKEKKKYKKKEKEKEKMEYIEFKVIIKRLQFEDREFLIALPKNSPAFLKEILLAVKT